MLFKKIFLTDRFFYCIAFVILVFVLAFSFTPLFLIAKLLLVGFMLVVIFDWWQLRKSVAELECTRNVVEKLSLGDQQSVNYNLINNSNKELNIAIVDELPSQLQIRDLIIDSIVKASDSIAKKLTIKPLTRGKYNFGNLNLYASNLFPGLVEIRKILAAEKTTEVYPSIIQMKNYELQVFSKTATLMGIRKARKIGESNEFEHIRPYIQGDNIKSINWKATSRKNQLMVNEYQNTRSQTVYTIIDKGRAMKMPFFEMTLLDHAINSALVISNIVLKKYDKAGLITFSDKIGSIVKASTKQGQLDLISNRLYNQKTDFKEPNYELVYLTIRKQVKRRSIIMLYTNFENIVDVQRNLGYIKSIGKKHLLVLILFINTELLDAAEEEVTSKSGIYVKTFADKALHEKEKIARLLTLHGIQVILTKPEDLSINVINKYLEIKSKRAQ